jgi:hypothetical protein
MAAGDATVGSTPNWSKAKRGTLAETIAMSIKEILEELPKLLNHEMAHELEEETPELLA